MSPMTLSYVGLKVWHTNSSTAKYRFTLGYSYGGHHGIRRAFFARKRQEKLKIGVTVKNILLL